MASESTRTAALQIRARTCSGCPYISSASHDVTSLVAFATYGQPQSSGSSCSTSWSLPGLALAATLPWSGRRDTLDLCQPRNTDQEHCCDCLIVCPSKKTLDRAQLTHPLLIVGAHLSFPELIWHWLQLRSGVCKGTSRTCRQINKRGTLLCLRCSIASAPAR